MGICLVCGLAEHGECRCDEIQYEIAFKAGWTAAKEKAARTAEIHNVGECAEICRCGILAERIRGMEPDCSNGCDHKQHQAMNPEGDK